jgi:hypothetical protein
LFGLSEGTPVQVLVPLDVVAPYHIRHDSVTVIPSSDRLLVAPTQGNFKNLVEAIGIARQALAHLPQTPVLAAGLNLTYKSESEVEVLEQATSSTWDDRLSDRGFVISSRSIVRSVNWRDGTINVTIKQEPTGMSSVHFNFDFKSQDSEALRTWLDLKAEEIKERVDTILFGTIGLCPEDIGDA